MFLWKSLETSVFHQISHECLILADSRLKGKLAIHDIVVEEDLVNYWQQFGAIAFDSAQKAMLTKCCLRSPDLQSKHPRIPCCFSFTIVRDPHNM